MMCWQNPSGIHSQTEGTDYRKNHPLFTNIFFTIKNHQAFWNGFLQKIKHQEKLEIPIVGTLIKNYFHIGKT